MDFLTHFRWLVLYEGRNSPVSWPLLLWNLGLEWDWPGIWARWICKMDLSLVCRRVCAVPLGQCVGIGLFIQEGNRAKSQIRALGLRWPWIEFWGKRQWEIHLLGAGQAEGREFIIHSFLFFFLLGSLSKINRPQIHHGFIPGLSILLPWSVPSYRILSILVLHRWKLFQRHNQRIACILKGPSEPESIFLLHVGSHHWFLDQRSSSCGSNSTCDDAVELHCYTEHVFLGSSSSSGDWFHLLITSISLCPLGSRVKTTTTAKSKKLSFFWV